jgi:hypothetical protein
MNYFQLFGDWTIQEAYDWHMTVKTPQGVILRYRSAGPVLPFYIKIYTDLYADKFIFKWAEMYMPKHVRWWILKELVLGCPPTRVTSSLLS